MKALLPLILLTLQTTPPVNLKVGVTSGCTYQAQEFQKDADKLIDKNAFVVGVSGDRVDTQVAFRKEYKLEFPLLADEKGDVGKLFGVASKPGGEIRYTIEGVQRIFQRGVTYDRWTFIIGLDGKIAYKNTRVAPEKDSKEVLAAIAKLQ
jgi:thioredoxin-dependent peroxiredoxin